MIPAAVRVTMKVDPDLGRPPTTVAKLLEALDAVSVKLSRDDLDVADFVALVRVMPVGDLRAYLDARPPTAQWIERKLVRLRRAALADKPLDEAIGHATAVLRGELWLAS